MGQGELKRIRNQIDRIDDQLLTLLNERAACASEIATVKQELNTSDTPVFYQPDRESLIMARLIESNSGPLTDMHVEQLFNEITSCCLSLEQPLTIGYLGPAGTYTQSAAIKRFGHFAVTKAHASIDEVFREVTAGNCNYGVVPVENSTEGMVNHTLDCLISSQVNICGEIELPIHHAFIVPRGVEPGAITAIYSHEQSLAQCRQWLDTHFVGIERLSVSSNAEAARIVSQRRDAAAIAGELAAEQYNLVVLHRNIEDRSENTTRFLVLGTQDVGPTGNDKTSILVMADDEPGSLYHVLAPFQQHKINLSRIETRPSSHSTWSYVFFIDFDGHESDESIRLAMKEIERVSIKIRSLGSYPRAARP